MENVSKGRYNPRFKFSWPVLYGTKDFVAQGTLLDLSVLGGRIAGTMPVEEGQRVWLRLQPPFRNDDVRVEQARVVWVNHQIFGIELKDLPPADHHWLLNYLDRAERRSTFCRTASQQDERGLSLTPLVLPLQTD